MTCGNEVIFMELHFHDIIAMHSFGRCREYASYPKHQNYYLLNGEPPFLSTLLLAKASVQ